MAGRRILGLDLGERRIGVAISDPEGRLAVPLRSIERQRGGDALQAIEAIIAADEVGEVVVGLPLSLTGEAGAQAEASRAFAAGLESRTGLPVRLYDERLSTREASQRAAGPRSRRRRERRRTPAGDIDAMAAAIILQAYLDWRRFAEA